MKFIILLLLSIILAILLLFIYSALVLAKESDMWMDENINTRSK